MELRLRPPLGGHSGCDSQSSRHVNHGHWCQFSAHRNPHFGVRGRRRLPSGKTAQWLPLGCEDSDPEAALGQALGRGCSAPCGGVWFGSAGAAGQRWVEGKGAPRARGKVTSWTEPPPLTPDWFVLMQMRTPSPQSVIGPKGTVLMGQGRATLVGQSCSALIGWGEPQSSWLKWTQKELPKGWADAGPGGRAGSADGGPGPAAPQRAGCTGGPCVKMAPRLCCCI